MKNEKIREILEKSQAQILDIFKKEKLPQSSYGLHSGFNNDDYKAVRLDFIKTFARTFSSMAKNPLKLLEFMLEIKFKNKNLREHAKNPKVFEALPLCSPPPENPWIFNSALSYLAEDKDEFIDAVLDLINSLEPFVEELMIEELSKRKEHTFFSNTTNEMIGLSVEDGKLKKEVSPSNSHRFLEARYPFLIEYVQKGTMTWEEFLNIRQALAIAFDYIHEGEYFEGPEDDICEMLALGLNGKEILTRSTFLNSQEIPFRESGVADLCKEGFITLEQLYQELAPEIIEELNNNPAIREAIKKGEQTIEGFILQCDKRKEASHEGQKKFGFHKTVNADRETLTLQKPEEVKLVKRM